MTGNARRKQQACQPIDGRGRPDEDKIAARREASRLRAKVAVIPAVQSATVIESFCVTGKPDLVDLIAELRRGGDAAASGDLTNAERMLSAQAHALDAIFANLARRAEVNIGEHLGAAETYLRLALKAQAQCRATLETLAAIKNPPHVAFVRQANIAHGHQQVNNGSESAARGNGENSPIELLEASHASQRLDTRTPRTASAGYPSLEAVAAVHRATDGDRQGEGEA